MELCVVIPAKNAASTIGACVAGVLRQTCPVREVIVVDDGSADATAALAEAAGARVIKQDSAGPAAARNRGTAESSGEYIAFTDADCEPHEDWLAKLASGFDEGVGAVGGSYGIANPSSGLARLIHAEIVRRHARLGAEVDFLGTYNMAVRREVFEAVGGFDEGFRAAACEDNDLCYRLGAAGWRLRYIPEALVDHHHPERLGRYLRAQARHGYWRVQLYRKHRGRIRGDRYAGFLDLVAPPWAAVNTALFLALPAVLWTGHGSALAQGMLTAASVGTYAVWRTAQSVQLWRMSGDRRMLEYGDMAFVRDLARVWGLGKGIVGRPAGWKEATG